MTHDIGTVGRLLNRISGFFKLHGISHKIAAVSNGDLAIIIKDLKNQGEYCHPKPARDMSKRDTYCIPISDDLNIKMARIWGKGVKVYIYYNGVLIGNKMIPPDEYFAVSRFLNLDKESLKESGLLEKLSGKHIDTF